MSVIKTDEPDHVTITSTTVLHVRRIDAAPPVPSLCGDRYAPGTVIAEGEELGSAWPYDGWCVECKDRQFGDYDDPLQPVGE